MLALRGPFELHTTVVHVRARELLPHLAPGIELVHASSVLVQVSHGTVDWSAAYGGLGAPATRAMPRATCSEAPPGTRTRARARARAHQWVTFARYTCVSFMYGHGASLHGSRAATAGMGCAHTRARRQNCLLLHGVHKHCACAEGQAHVECQRALHFRRGKRTGWSWSDVDRPCLEVLPAHRPFDLYANACTQRFCANENHAKITPV